MYKTTSNVPKKASKPKKEEKKEINGGIDFSYQGGGEWPTYLAPWLPNIIKLLL